MEADINTRIHELTGGREWRQSDACPAFNPPKPCRALVSDYDPTVWQELSSPVPDVCPDMEVPYYAEDVSACLAVARAIWPKLYVIIDYDDSLGGMEQEVTLFASWHDWQDYYDTGKVDFELGRGGSMAEALLAALEADE